MSSHPSPFARRLTPDTHASREARRILVVRRWLGLADDTHVPIDPPDGPVKDEGSYEVVLGRLERLSWRAPEQLDLNGVPIGYRVVVMQEALKQWNASLPVELLRSYELKIIEVKRRLRTSWPADFSPEHADLQRELIRLRARVTSIYRDRHEVRQARRTEVSASSCA